MKKTIITLFVVLMMLQISVTKNTIYADVHGKNNGPHRGVCEVINGTTICYADDSKEIFDKYHAEQEAKQNNESNDTTDNTSADDKSDWESFFADNNNKTSVEEPPITQLTDEEQNRRIKEAGGVGQPKTVYIPQNNNNKNQDEAARQAAEEAARIEAERLAKEEAARKAEAEKLAREKAEEEARIKAQKDAEEKARLEAEANKVKDNGHGYTREEVHNNASGYKKDISTVSTKKANVNGNQLDEELQKQIEDELFKLMNETRAKVNSQALTRTNLNAETWADMMLETGLFEHAKLFNEYKYEGKTKVITKEVAAGVGDNWSSAGENIAWRSYAPDQLAATYLNSQWNKSTGHYNNRINSTWKYYDISVVKGEDGQWYAVERFAR